MISPLPEWDGINRGGLIIRGRTALQPPQGVIAGRVVFHLTAPAPWVYSLDAPDVSIDSSRVEQQVAVLLPVPGIRVPYALRLHHLRV